MKEDHVSCLFKDIRINKAPSKSQSSSNKLKCVLFFVVDYESAFLLVATFLIINFSIFCFLYMIGVYEPDMFRQSFLPVGF